MRHLVAVVGLGLALGGIWAAMKSNVPVAAALIFGGVVVVLAASPE